MDYFVGEIRLVAFSYAPVDWALCNGALLKIQDSPELFSLIGATYGGDGTTTFALPNLNCRVPIGQGQGQAQGQNLTPRIIGQMMGTESVALSVAQLPSHTHSLSATTSPATTSDPANAVLAQGQFYYAPPAGQPPPADAAMAPGSVSSSGGTAAHPNLMPSLGLYYIIATSGLYPHQD